MPPATASLMYAPEIYGRSDVQTVKVVKESQLISGKDFIKNQKGLLIGIGVAVVLAIIGFIILKRKGATSPPPTPPQQGGNVMPDVNLPQSNQT